MSRIRSLVPLGLALEAVNRPTSVEALQRYNLLGVRLDGAGPFLRETKPGSAIAASTLYEVRAGDFVYSRLFAWRGAFGVVSEALDRSFVSGEFPTFRPRDDRLDVHYLKYWFRLPDVLDQVLADCTGSTPLTRNRFKEEFFLRLEIPLPPLEEQRRIVARVDALAAKIEEARGLRGEAHMEAMSLVASGLYQAFVTEADSWQSMPMPRAVVITAGQVNPTLPIYSELPHISGENIESRTCKLLPFRTAAQDGVKSGNYLFAPGAILYSKIRPYLRKATVVDFQGVCSADIYPLRVRSTELEPRFVMWSLVADPFSEYADRVSGRTRMPKLNRSQLFTFDLPYPHLKEQRRIVAYLDGLQAKADRLKALQAETSAELDALLPSILDRAFKGEL